MKKLLIIYTKMVVGGSTTSLLSLLNNINYEEYSVDLLLLDNSGDLQHLINNKVNILENEFKSNKIIRFCRPKAIFDRVKANYISKKNNNRLIKAQINSSHMAISMKPLKKEYDIAISFLEFWPMRFLSYKVTANQKIGWIHIDPFEAGLIPKYSMESLSHLDKIVLVSKSCKENFDKMFPMYKCKSVVIENILDSKIIRAMSEEKCDLCVNKSIVNLVTVCRVNLASKALERVVFALDRLKAEGYDVEQIIHWYIVGDGPDIDVLNEIINSVKLTNITLLGKKLNPYKYEKQMDYFILPSKYEGKPMAVTEAQMLGIVPIVCNYSSAIEQIENGVDGIIAENNEWGIYYPLKSICDKTIEYDHLKSSVCSKEFSNIHVINDIYSLFNDDIHTC